MKAAASAFSGRGAGAASASTQFEELYRANYSRIYNYLYGCLLHRERTEDLVSDVFFEALRSFPRYDRTKGSMGSWLGSIARHRLLDNFRRAQNRLEILSGDVPEPSTEQRSGAASLAGKTSWEDERSLKYPEHRAAIRILSQLSPKEREFLELRYGLELSDREIAAMYSVSREAIRKRYERLLAKCRRM